jgi:hypothetical protein
MGRRIAAAVFAAMLAPAVVWAQGAAQAPAPANNQIKGVYDDLNRFEHQASGARASSAKRILRLLKITEGRLKGAPNQDHPSWAAASQRLAALKQQLGDIAAGRQPGTTSTQTATPSAEPKIESAPAIEAAPAIESGDPVVAGAAQEIARISALVDEMAPGDKTTARKYLDELKAVGNTLRGAGTKDEAWSNAAKAFNALQKRVVAVANAAPGGGAASSQTAKADPNIARAMRDLDFSDRQLEGLTGNSKRSEQRILRDLDRIRQTLDKVADKSSPAWKEADGEWQRQRDGVAQKRLEALAKKYDALGKEIAGLDSTKLLDERTAGSLNSRIDDLNAQIKVHDAYISKPGYAETWNTQSRVMTLLVERTAKAKAAEGALGDVAGTVARIEARLRAAPVPRALQEFKSQEAVLAYTKALVGAYADNVNATKYLQSIDGKTNQVDKKTIRRLLRWAGTDRMRKVNASLEESKMRLNGQWEVYKGALEFRATDDPTKPDHRANRFLMDGRYEENVGQLEEGLKFVAIADAFDKALAIKNGDLRARQQAALSNAIAKYKADFQVALSTVRMTPGIGDDKLEAIAAETLKNPKYGVNLPWKRLEVGKKTRRKQEVSSLSGSTLVTNMFDWEEFQARTAEQEGGKWYIFVNDIKYFYSGGTTTPLNRWLVAKRWKSEQILEENIDK